MKPYNQPDSDINEQPVTITVVCQKCHKAEQETIALESLGEYSPFEENGKLYYISQLGECAECLGA